MDFPDWETLAFVAKTYTYCIGDGHANLVAKPPYFFPFRLFESGFWLVKANTSPLVILIFQVAFTSSIVRIRAVGEYCGEVFMSCILFDFQHFTGTNHTLIIIWMNFIDLNYYYYYIDLMNIVWLNFPMSPGQDKSEKTAAPAPRPMLSGRGGQTPHTLGAQRSLDRPAGDGISRSHMPPPKKRLNT